MPISPFDNSAYGQEQRIKDERSGDNSNGDSGNSYSGNSYLTSTSAENLLGVGMAAHGPADDSGG